MSRSDINTRSRTKQTIDLLVRPRKENAIDKRKLKNRRIAKFGTQKSKLNSNTDLLDNLIKSDITQKNRINKVQQNKTIGVNNNQVFLINNNLPILQTESEESTFLEDGNLLRTLKVEVTSKTYTIQKTKKKFALKSKKKVAKKNEIKLQAMPLNKKHKNLTYNLTNENITKDCVESQNGLDKQKSNKNITKETVNICDDISKKQNNNTKEKAPSNDMNLKQLYCNHCNKSYSKKYYVRLHVINHFDIAEAKIFTCDLCDKSFFLKENLSIHLMNHTNDVQYYQCFCGRTFGCQHNIFRHEEYHLRNKFKCPKCKKKLMTCKRLIKHAKSHSITKDFQCHFCGKNFIQNSSIKRHLKICQSGFSVKCPICNKKLKGHLTEHIRTHVNSKPHVCQECGRRFTQATQLTVHRRRHTGSKPFECRICRRCFTHSNAMLTHFRVHTGERPYNCPLCPLSFNQSPHMKTHMLTIHGKAEAYKCPNCNEFFKMKRHLQTHSNKCVIKESLSEINKGPTNQSPDSKMNLSRMRFLLALLLTMISKSNKLKCLGFNKRLIDDILIDVLQALNYKPCKDNTMTNIKRLKINIETLLNATIPKYRMQLLKKAEKTTEDMLELLTDDKTSCSKIFQ